MRTRRLSERRLAGLLALLSLATGSPAAQAANAAAQLQPANAAAQLQPANAAAQVQPANAPVGAQPAADADEGLPARATLDARPTIARALDRLYNFDFDEAHTILDAYVEQQPDDPLGHAFRGVVFLTYELDRLKIFESKFFTSDKRIKEKKSDLEPDPQIKTRLMEALDHATALAEARLAEDPRDVRALFTMSLREGTLTDYYGLIEKRGIKSYSNAKAANRYSNQLLEIEPEFYDAHLAGGINEYLIGSLPLIIRWFVRMDGVEGSKDRAFERLALVAEHGRYMAPFARILLSIVYLREKQPEKALVLLAELSADYPENPLMREELRLLTERLANGEV